MQGGMGETKIIRPESQVALDGYNKEKHVELKGSSADLVTETDKKVEDMIRAYLKEKFPSHRYIHVQNDSQVDTYC